MSDPVMYVQVLGHCNESSLDRSPTFTATAAMPSALVQRALDATGTPAAIMPTTPMPALPAPTTTMRWSLMACTGLPCTASAPYNPASAVAAVPYIDRVFTFYCTH